MAKRRSLTPFFDALSDLRVREKIKQQEISKLFEFDKFEGKTIFKAKVLTGCETGHQREDTTNPDNLYFPIVLRILDISDSIIPDPKDATTTEERSFLIGNHPIAYSDRPYNTKLGFVPRAGQIVDCYYRDPVNKRNLVYIYPQEDSIQDEAFCGGASSLRDGFGAGTGILGDFDPDIIRDAEKYDSEDVPNKSQHRSYIEGEMHPEFVPYAKAMIWKIYDSLGGSIRINSAFRTIARQTEMRSDWDDWVAKGSEPAKKPSCCAYRPASGGSSNHNYGVAFDFNPTINGNTLLQKSPKVDWVNSGIPKIIQSYGLRWGGDFGDNIHVDLVLSDATKTQIKTVMGNETNKQAAIQKIKDIKLK